MIREATKRVLSPEILHVIGKKNTQRLERTNGIVRQQTGRWHHRQNKFGKLWQQTANLNLKFRGLCCIKDRMLRKGLRFSRILKMSGSLELKR